MIVARAHFIFTPLIVHQNGNYNELALILLLVYFQCTIFCKNRCRCDFVGLCIGKLFTSHFNLNSRVNLLFLMIDLVIITISMILMNFLYFNRVIKFKFFIAIFYLRFTLFAHSIICYFFTFLFRHYEQLSSHLIMVGLDLAFAL